MTPRVQFNFDIRGFMKALFDPRVITGTDTQRDRPNTAVRTKRPNIATSSLKLCNRHIVMTFDLPNNALCVPWNVVIRPAVVSICLRTF